MRTPRLLMLAADEALLRAELTSRAALADELDARVGDGWPPPLYDQEAVRMWCIAQRDEATARQWPLFYLLEPALHPRTRDSTGWRAIGVGGFKAAPDPAGSVEIGLSLLPAWQGRGLGSEVTRSLLDYAFGHPAVVRVVAHTLPSLAASITALRRCGFRYRGRDDGTDRPDAALRFEISREDHAAKGEA